MLSRSITPKLLSAWEDTPVIFLAGARQTGKSTLVENLANKQLNADYLTFDDIGILSAAKNDPQGFVAGLPMRVVLDEVQRAPEIVLPIKALVDRERKTRRVLLTGSANVLVLPRLSDTLAGRMEIHELWPFSQSEFSGARENVIDFMFSEKMEFNSKSVFSEDEILDRVITGGYPEMMERKTASRRSAWFQGYLATIIQREVKDIAGVDNISLITDLLRLIASRTANLINYANLSRVLQIPQTSLKRYVALLEAVYLIRRMESWHGNITNRIAKAPKLHLVDSGLCCHLLGADYKRLQDDRVLTGQVIESFAVNEMVRHAGWSTTQVGLHHFRSHDGKEVDLVLEDSAGNCIVVEVKAAKTVSSHDTAGIRFLKEAIGRRFVRGVVLYTGQQVIPFDKDIHALPINVLWR